MYRKLDKILAVVIPLVVIFLSIGYSILNKELSVTGDLIYRAKADIRITNVRLDSVNSTVESFSPNFSK